MNNENSLASANGIDETGAICCMDFQRWRTAVPTVVGSLVCGVLVFWPEPKGSSVLSATGLFAGGGSAYLHTTTDTYTYGWPYEFLASEVVHSAGDVKRRYQWHAWPLVIDATANCFLLAGIECWSRSRRRRKLAIYQLTLIEYLAAVTWIAYHGSLAWSAAKRYDRETPALEALSIAGHSVTKEYAGPVWVRRLIGPLRHPMWWVTTEVSIRDATFSELSNAIDQLSRLSNLKELDISGSAATDECVDEILQGCQLEQLNCCDCRMVHFSSVASRHCQALRRLYCDNTGVDDDGIIEIARMRGLEELNIGRTRITERSLSRLAVLAHLRELVLCNTTISDAAGRELFDAAHIDVVHLPSGSILRK